MREPFATLRLAFAASRATSSARKRRARTGSLFQYAIRRLLLSEPAAYGHAARAARRFPTMLQLLDEGALSLTTIGLLVSHLTDDNHALLLEAARHKTKREVEVMVAALRPHPTSARASGCCRSSDAQRRSRDWLSRNRSPGRLASRCLVPPRLPFWALCLRLKPSFSVET